MGISYLVETSREINLKAGEKTIFARGGDFHYSFFGTPRDADSESTPDDTSLSNDILTCSYTTLPTDVFVGEDVFINSSDYVGTVKEINDTLKTIKIVVGTLPETITGLIFPKSSYLIENEALTTSYNKIFFLGIGDIDVEYTGTSYIKKKIV